MAFEALRDRWENMAPREKRLVLALGVAVVASVFGFIGLQIRSGLNDLDSKNSQTRYALRLIDEHQEEVYAKRDATDNPEHRIPDSAQPLATYLDGIATQVGVTIPESSERPAVTRGKYHELSIDVKLHGVSLDQLAKFLKLVETNGQAVVTQRLYVKPYISAHDKLDVELTIAAYEKAKPGSEGKGKGKGPKGKPVDSDDKSGG
jgi:type II secretory pathway component PulM